MRAYHFLNPDFTSPEGGSPWAVGETRTWDGPILLYNGGYRSHPSWLDCLGHTNGTIACVVEVSDPIEHDTSTHMSQSRKLVAARDARPVLRAFACDCAARALSRDQRSDPRYEQALVTARVFLDGWASIDDLIDAREQAMRAAREATSTAATARVDSVVAAVLHATASDAVLAALRAITSSATIAAVRDAASDAVLAAVLSAPDPPVREVEREWQRRHLAELLDPFFADYLKG